MSWWGKELRRLRKPQEISADLYKYIYSSFPFYPHSFIFALKTMKEEITNEVHQGYHFNPLTPLSTLRIQTTLFRSSSQQLCPTYLDFQHGFPPTLTQSTFFRNPHRSPPLWILLTFSIGRRNGMQRLRGTGLTTPSPPSVFFTLPLPLSYTRNMINWCPAHPLPKSRRWRVRHPSSPFHNTIETMK